MGVYQATSEVASAFESNFATKLSTVATAAGVTVDTAASFYRRERYATFLAKAKQGIGIFVLDGSTQAVSQGLRRWRFRFGIDICYQDDDRDTVTKQVELGVDAALRVIDGLAGTGTLAAAAEEAFTTTTITDLDQLIQAQADSPSSQGPYQAGARIEFEIEQRETI